MAVAEEGQGSVEQVLDEWREQGIRYVRFELPDMHGTSRSKTIPIEHCASYAESGLNMYGGAVVLDSRSDVVSGTLYNEEIAYADQRLWPDPSTAARGAVGRRDRPDDLRHRLGRRNAARRGAAAGLPARPRTLPRARLRAADRHRARVLRPRRRDPRAALRGLPHLQHGAELLGAAHPADRRRDARLRGRHHHRELRVRRLAVGDQLRPRSRARGARTQTFTFKNGVKELAHLEGYIATFMSKPFSDSAGCGAHNHITLLDLDERRERDVGRRRRARAHAGRASLHRGAAPARTLDVRAARADRELPEAPANAHLQPDERLVGTRGSERPRPDQGRLGRVAPRREPRADRALEPVSGVRGPPRPRACSVCPRSWSSSRRRRRRPRRTSRRSSSRKPSRSRSRLLEADEKLVELLGSEFVHGVHGHAPPRAAALRRPRDGLGARGVPGALLTLRAMSGVRPFVTLWPRNEAPMSASGPSAVLAPSARLAALAIHDVSGVG